LLSLKIAAQSAQTEIKFSDPDLSSTRMFDVHGSFHHSTYAKYALGEFMYIRKELIVIRAAEQ